MIICRYYLNLFRLEFVFPDSFSIYTTTALCLWAEKKKNTLKSSPKTSSRANSVTCVRREILIALRFYISLFALFWFGLKDKLCWFFFLFENFLISSSTLFFTNQEWHLLPSNCWISSWHSEGRMDWLLWILISRV